MEENLLLTDSDIGIVEIPIVALTSLNKWFSLQPPPVEHVTGDVHVQIMLRGAALTVKLLDCSNLAAQDPNGLSDPYVVIQYGNHKKKSKIIKKTLNPFFGETFLFRWDDSIPHIEIDVWDWDRIGGHDFL